MSYQPKPLDVKGVELTPEVEELIERLAESVHDRWAERRMAEGWTYGASRSDSLKTHPGLVPYAELTESEKEYDRESARQTVKGILAMGFEIRRILNSSA